MASRAERREVEGFGGGEADVFDGHADEAAGDVHGVFAGLEHAAEPVERGVGVGVADGFVQGGDEVVVLLALLVVEEDALLEGFDGYFFVIFFLRGLRRVWRRLRER